MFNFTNDTQTQSANTRTFQKLFLKVTKIFQNITFFYIILFVIMTLNGSDVKN